MKTGPVGVILTTMNKSYETAELIHKDFENGSYNSSGHKTMQYLSM